MSKGQLGAVAGIARYTGANAVVQLTDTPSDSGSGGVALPANPTTAGAGDMRTIRNIDVYTSGGGTVTVTYDGTAPTAAYGDPIDTGLTVRNRSRAELAAMKFFVPTGTTLHVKYYWGTL
jgi:hypothetical protein